MKKIWVRDLNTLLEKEISEVFYLKDITYSDSDGRRWQDLLLVDVTGRMIGKCWGEYIQDSFKNYQGKVVRVTGMVELFRDMYGMKVVDVKLASEDEYNISDFRVCISDSEGDLLLARLNELISSVVNEKYRTLLCGIFTPSKINKFKSLPATKNLHHAYDGGWLKHTIEVAELALAAAEMCKRGPMDIVDVDHDLLLTGALLHDVGIISSLKQAIEPSLTRRGRLVGHVHDGAVYITCVNSSISSELRVDDLTELLHIVVSAHVGESNVMPMTKEAVIVSRSDALSASFSAVDTLFYNYDMRYPEDRGKEQVYSNYFETNMTRINRGR